MRVTIQKIQCRKVGPIHDEFPEIISILAVLPVLSTIVSRKHVAEKTKKCQVSGGIISSRRRVAHHETAGLEGQ